MGKKQKNKSPQKLFIITKSSQNKKQKIKKKKLKLKKVKNISKKTKPKKGKKAKKNPTVLSPKELFFLGLADEGYFDEELYSEGELIPDKYDIYEEPKTMKEQEEYLKNLIKESDIILEILDARDIEYSLDKKIEKLVSTENKVLFYVINKIDLVSDNYLKSIIKQLSKISKKVVILTLSCIKREKIDEFYNNLKKEIGKQKFELKPNKKKNEIPIKIGIVGVPNVGKSSLVQSLELIVTSNCENKYISFEGNNFCINSVPGTNFDNNENEKTKNIISKKYKNVNDIPYPLKLLTNLFNYVNQNKIKEIYGLNKKPDNIQGLINLLKKKFGIKTDKIIEQQILKDVITGKIYYEVNFSK